MRTSVGPPLSAASERRKFSRSHKFSAHIWSIMESCMKREQYIACQHYQDNGRLLDICKSIPKYKTFRALPLLARGAFTELGIDLPEAIEGSLQVKVLRLACQMERCVPLCLNMCCICPHSAPEICLPQWLRVSRKQASLKKGSKLSCSELVRKCAKYAVSAAALVATSIPLLM